MPVRVNISCQGTGTAADIKTNVRRSSEYPKVEWAEFKYPIAAVVGGGVSVKSKLGILRQWPGDIFAINDTAKFLSDNGIQCILFAVDTTQVPYKIGPLVTGAILASRVHRIQFTQLKGRDVKVFDMAEEDSHKGIEGGPTAVCRTPHLLLRMGYKGVRYFGCEGSFELDKTHTSGYSRAAYDNMMIITAGGIDYYTNAAFMLQTEYMSDVIIKYKPFLSEDSGGLLEAMIKYPDTWTISAIADDFKGKFETSGCKAWNVKYQGGNEVWQPQQAI